MRIILHSSSFYILGAVVLIGIAVVLLISTFKDESRNLITTAVERGDVAEIVSVSGVVEAESSAELAFPISGIVSEVLVTEGQMVQKGDVLATLISSQLAAERQSAVAALQRAIADKDELVSGPRQEARTVTETSVKNAKTNLAQVTLEQNEKVENARRTLLSSGLEAYSIDGDESASAPTITGTYTCNTEGAYAIQVYNSGTASGYSFSLSGLERGVSTVFTGAPGPLGSCGLLIQFNSSSNYGSSEWTVPVPNINGASYQTNLNSYTLAVQQRDTAIASAENALNLAKGEAALSNATPRGEEMTRANAAILQSNAQVNAIDAQIADRSIIAPFDGVITDVNILPGETATTQPIITLLASGAFKLVARVPEIDITKIADEQDAEVVFDAQNQTIIPANISFISPLAIEIDGVAYFEATIEFGNPPEWLRSGLNADIDIIVQKISDTLRLPQRFVITENDTSTVLRLTNEKKVVPTSVETVFEGNDGFTAITGLNEGDIVVAPSVR